MFTGIIETAATITHIEKENDNIHYTLTCPIVAELKIDQSLSHDGVCLTVVALQPDSYTVTAIKETLEKTNLKEWTVGTKVNLERAMKLGDRLDGHIVQGHVDQTGVCTAVEEAGGSWYFTFTYDAGPSNITIEKGSITVNGVSLTVVNSKANEFSVAIIPYTYEHTNFNTFKVGTTINLEFDVVGKYVARLHALRS
ncbi:riboflavin synthase [Flavobacterium subsaxonicum]|uniref:Riboflavin synthase n=1 Tax=Flavobacterium subsaxonicum WB 4.1-42 = DSM 21790 TaxID=1121898 RepID=A0A0A2MHZ1_9FLAO|nr:riboflavin synthase [Flavobacterium subsaxonicum]KGO91078.1 riboflavin synthase subunit alpha [Flavobacterium subsaxonicum WB 4.1-42 = DSM 21790]